MLTYADVCCDLKGNELRDYQTAGVNWLVFNWLQVLERERERERERAREREIEIEREREREIDRERERERER